MKRLDQNRTNINPPDVGGGQKALRLVFEGIKIFDAELGGHANRHKPKHPKELGQKEGGNPPKTAQERLRVKNRDTQKEYVQKGRLDLFLRVLLIAFKKLGSILHALVQEHVRLVQLRKHLDDLALARDVFGAAVEDLAPNLAHRFFGGQARNEFIGALRQAVILVGIGLKKHIPQDSTVRLTTHPDTGPESYSAPAKPVPGFVENLALLVENHLLKPVTPQKQMRQTGRPLQRAGKHR